MKVEDLMIIDVMTCFAEEDLSRVAQTMWEGDCGTVVVIDSEKRAVGMITDRDIAMGAFTKGLPLSAIRVRDAMARDVFGCSPWDSLEAAMGVMRRWRVRRLPVMDRHGRLVGILSLHDLVREAERARRAGDPRFSVSEFVKTYAEVCRPWKELAAPVAAKSGANRAGSPVGSVSARQADIEC